MEWLIPAFIGFLGGTVASLVAPWVHWSIETRRFRLNYKRERIEHWRHFIDTFDWDNDSFGDSSVYAAMRPHMDSDRLKRFETPRAIIIPPDSDRGTNLFKQWAADEISRIEKQWGLS